MTEAGIQRRPHAPVRGYDATSAVETTALALDGLATYRRILDGRAKGMLGASPADAAGAVLRR